MVGEIDFIFSKGDYPKAIELLENYAYTHNYKIDKLLNKKPMHYPRLVNENKIAAIEIHKELL